MPPVMENDSSKLYDSVQGQTGGSDVFMIYANKKAYPEYLITYKWNLDKKIINFY